MMPRLLHQEDIRWAVDLAERCYDRKLEHDSWIAFVEKMLNRNDFMIVRGENACVVASIQRDQKGELEGVFPYWFGENPHELPDLFMPCFMWMAKNGVPTAKLEPDKITGTNAAPLARALGFEPGGPPYVKKLMTVH